MRNCLRSVTLLAISMTIVTAGAWGQVLSAEIPFPFHANGANLPPGHYVISRIGTGGAPVMLLMNRDARKSALAVGYLADDKGVNPSPRMTFQCTDGDCTLSQIWGLSYGVDLPRSHPKHKENAQIMIVPATQNTKAD